MQRLAEVHRSDSEFEELLRDLVNTDASRFIELAVGFFGDRLAMTTSFGIYSALMLHLVTQVKPDIPVIWVDTGYLFPETYKFAQKLTKGFRLNLRVYQSPLSPARMEAIQGRLWAEKTEEALDRYHLIRKIEPLQRAFKELGITAWLAGLRAEQTDYRSTLDRIHQIDGRYRLLPILEWNSKRVEDYIERHNLPEHPLREKGYVSVGDWHSSRPLSAKDDTGRETRFQGMKQECGIHLPLTPEAEESLRSSGL